MTDDLKHISRYLDNLDKRVEQWGQETTVEAANETLKYMENQQYKLNETVRDLDEKISKTKRSAAKTILMELKSRTEIHQQQIRDRVEKINNHLFKLTELKGKVIQLEGEMKSIASDIKISFVNDNPKNETSGETLDEALTGKAEELREWAEYNPSDFLYPWGDADLDFEIRNRISIRHVLGIAFDNILRLLRLHPKYETYNKNADLAKPLEEKRDDVLSYLDELEGKTAPKTTEPAKTRQVTNSDNTGDNQNKNQLTREAKALAMLVEHPDWPDTEIAKAIGVNRTTLYDWPKFKKAKEALKQGKNELPSGSKNGESGDIEAWD